MSKPGSGTNPPPPPREKAGMTTKQLTKFAETRARELREIAGVGPEEPLDPLALATRFGILVVTPEQVMGLPGEHAETLGSLSAKEFSGGARVLPDGTLLVIANPKQTPERLRSTVMEEVAHRHLGHKPSIITAGPNGAGMRTHDKELEHEAYWTGAAALLPAICVSRSIWKQEPAATIAARFGVSVELVEFRIKTLNLWDQYQRYCPQPEEGDHQQ